MSTRGIPVALGDFRSRGSVVKATKGKGDEQRGARVNEWVSDTSNGMRVGTR